MLDSTPQARDAATVGAAANPQRCHLTETAYDSRVVADLLRKGQAFAVVGSGALPIASEIGHQSQAPQHCRCRWAVHERPA